MTKFIIKWGYDERTVKMMLLACMTALIILIIMPTSLGHENETMDTETVLQNTLFHAYNRYRKPVKIYDRRVQVGLDLHILSLPKLDIRSQTLHTAIWLSVSWTDEYLTWNSDDFSGINFLRLPANKVWIPAVCNMHEISGRRCLTYSSVGNTNSEVEIESNGHVSLSEAMESIILCTFNVKNFPFDTQICTFTFFASTKRSHSLKIMLNQSSFDSRYFIGNEEWDLISTNVQNNAWKLEMNIVLRRRPLFLTLTLVFPIITLSFMNVFCYVLPIESGEKMGMSVALFLTFAVFGSILSDAMPKDSENISIFIVYVIVQIFLSGLSVVLETIVLRIYHAELGPLSRLFQLKENKNAVSPSVEHIEKKSKNLENECNLDLKLDEQSQTNLDEKRKTKAKEFDKNFLIFHFLTNIITFLICTLIIMS